MSVVVFLQDSIHEIYGEVQFFHWLILISCKHYKKLTVYKSICHFYEAPPSVVLVAPLSKWSAFKSDLVSNQGLFILLIFCCFFLVVFLIRVAVCCSSLNYCCNSIWPPSMVGRGPSHSICWAVIIATVRLIIADLQNFKRVSICSAYQLGKRNLVFSQH